jgi:XTP/dITP diphosphohydrolase
MLKIVFATNNEHKLTEIKELLGNNFLLLKLSDVNIFEDIPEDMPTLEGNALFKARYVHKATGMNVFADDTGLEIEELNGKPGVHSARFAGNNRDFKANIQKVLELMKGTENRNAQFRTVIALVMKGKEFLFSGKAEGTLLNEEHGSGGFGYDPIFVPKGGQKSFAEMSLAEKNKISHRAMAFKELIMFLNQDPVSDNNALN